MNKKIMKRVAGTLVLAALLSVQTAEAAITMSLDFGASGSQVTELQAYLAKNPSIYPEGLVTGYFGSLTQAAVQRFQTAQGIVSSGTPETTGYGRVGPTTRARINALMGTGISLGQAWDEAPFIGGSSVITTDTSVKLTWTSNENTVGQVYYDDSHLTVSEVNSAFQKPYVSGTLVTDNGGSRTTHDLTITGLDADTTYYFRTQGIDSAGNVSITSEQSFTTEEE